MFYSNNRPHFIGYLSLFLEILENMCIAIVCFSDRDMNFEINLIFLIKPFFYLTEKTRQKYKYPENEKSF